MYNNISDDKLYFDTAWYAEQISNASTKEKIQMEDKGIHKADIRDGDKPAASGDEKVTTPCCCCEEEEIECRLPTNEWTDD